MKFNGIEWNESIELVYLIFLISIQRPSDDHLWLRLVHQSNRLDLKSFLSLRAGHTIADQIHVKHNIAEVQHKVLLEDFFRSCVHLPTKCREQSCNHFLFDGWSTMVYHKSMLNCLAKFGFLTQWGVRTVHQLLMGCLMMNLSMKIVKNHVRISFECRINEKNIRITMG